MWEPFNIQDVPAPGCGGDIARVTPVVVHVWANVTSVDSIQGYVGAL